MLPKVQFNMGFARCGVEGNLRKFLENTRKKLSIFQFFRNFKKWKKFLLAFRPPLHFRLQQPAPRKALFRCGKIRSAPLATPNRGFCHIGSADYIRRCCSSLRELRTSVNLLNPKNGSKLPSRDFANPPNRQAILNSRLENLTHFRIINNNNNEVEGKVIRQKIR